MRYSYYDPIQAGTWVPDRSQMIVIAITLTCEGIHVYDDHGGPPSGWYSGLDYDSFACCYYYDGQVNRNPACFGCWMYPCCASGSS